MDITTDGVAEDTSTGLRHMGGSGCEIEFYTSQPAPTQWIAVGLATVGPDYSIDPPRRFLVGTGVTEAAAVTALRSRCPIHGALERPARIGQS